MQVMFDRIDEWEPVFPLNPALRDTLREGSEAYVHPNAAGHRLFAEAMWEALTSERPVDPLALSPSKTWVRPKRRS
jgi:lysophospholipase L1-like esterase